MKQNGGLDAGFIAHPSLVTSESLQAITKPLSIAAAGKKTSESLERS